MILNIRGANGAGKTTAARWFLEGNLVPVDLAHYKTEKGRERHVEGMVNTDKSVCLVGSYKNACGGMDAIPSFALCFQSIGKAVSLTRYVVCEGVLASTVFGSWADFAKDKPQFAFCYLRVPLAECLRRVYVRNGGKKINESLVAGKIRAVEATRKKALAAKLLVYDLPLGEGEAGPALWEIAQGRGEHLRGR